MDEGSTNTTAADRLVLEYLHARGYKSAERALAESLESYSPNLKGKQQHKGSITMDEMTKRIAVFAQKPSRPGENVFKEGSTVLQELTAMGNSPDIQALIASMGAVGAEEIMSNDPMNKQEGFRQLESWVDGSLDMYRVRVSVQYFFTVFMKLEYSLSSGRYCFLYSCISTLTLYRLVTKTQVRLLFGLLPYGLTLK